MSEITIDEKWGKTIIEQTGKGTARKRCTCHHDFQDKRCGRGIRVHNRTSDGQWRCTVCGFKR